MARRQYNTDSSVLDWIRNDTSLASHSQVLLMYGSFQLEMPTDSRSSICNWLRQVVADHGVPSLMRIGPRSRPRVFRKDEFMQLLGQTSSTLAA